MLYWKIIKKLRVCQFTQTHKLQHSTRSNIFQKCCWMWIETPPPSKHIDPPTAHTHTHLYTHIHRIFAQIRFPDLNATPCCPTSALRQFLDGTCRVASFPMTSAMVRLFGKKTSLLVQENKVKMKSKSELLVNKEGGAKERKRIAGMDSGKMRRIGKITWLLLLLILPSFTSAEEQVLEGSKVTDSVELFDPQKHLHNNPKITNHWSNHDDKHDWFRHQERGEGCSTSRQQPKPPPSPRGFLSKNNVKKNYFLFINQHCLLQVRDDPCSVHKEEKEERYHGRGFARGERNQDQSVHQRRHGRLGGGPR